MEKEYDEMNELNEGNIDEHYQVFNMQGTPIYETDDEIEADYIAMMEGGYYIVI